MARIIIVQNNADRMRYSATVEAFLRSSPSSLICIGSEPPAQNDPRIKFISSGALIDSSLREALHLSGEKNFILIDARVLPTGEEISALHQHDDEGGMIYVPVGQKNHHIYMPTITPTALLNWVRSQPMVPALMFRVSRETLTAALSPSAAIQISGLKELFMANLLIAHREGLEISPGDAFHELMPSEPRSEELQLSTVASGQVLRELVHDTNIEELFPQHAWKVHQKESAAAAYHSLAALFIKFNDVDSANECLTISDRLEDSPRSLALRGLIAMEKGETLGAVANLISSLQQYELRKQVTTEHYLAFKPENLDDVTTNLNAGLSALNKRDNETAMQFFASAVYQFDPFYREFGVEKKAR